MSGFRLVMAGALIGTLLIIALNPPPADVACGRVVLNVLGVSLLAVLIVWVVAEAGVYLSRHVRWQ